MRRGSLTLSKTSRSPRRLAAIAKLQFTQLAYGAIVDVLSGHHRTAAARLLREQYCKDIPEGNLRLSKLADDESSAEAREKLTRLVARYTFQPAPKSKIEVQQSNSA